MNHCYLLAIAITIATFASCSAPKKSEFVEVKGAGFTLNGEPYHFVGVNFWYGAYLGSPCAAGNRERLARELDLLKSIGITNLRVAATSEKSSFKRAVTPVFHEAPGVVNENLLIGLDYLLAEMAKRDMKAVLFLNNFWEWSGGMSAYMEWFEGKPAIDPVHGEWNRFMNQSARFYTHREANEAYRDYIRTLITRKNTITGRYNYEDPTIMSWQLANEPRPGAHDDEGRANIGAWVEWIGQTASFIKSIAPNQLVSTGNEGTMGSVSCAQSYLKAHSWPDVDYATVHLWPMNWRWFDASNPNEPIEPKLERVGDYLREHMELAKQLNKPIVLSEFGLNRDYARFDKAAPVTYRDKYLEYIFNLIEQNIPKGSPMVGSNFWSWGGYGEAQHEDYFWRAGDPFTGDPPQEAQGLYSVFATDSSTIGIFKKHAENLRGLRIVD